MKNKIKSLKRYVVMEDECGNYHGHFDEFDEAVKCIEGKIVSKKQAYETYYRYSLSRFDDRMARFEREANKTTLNFHIVDTEQQEIIRIDVDWTREISKTVMERYP